MNNSAKNILIVDDNVQNLHFLKEALKQEGYSTRPVTSGQAAFQTIEHTVPDLILLDINMPGMNGFEVCEILKSNTKTKDIPIIFLSALNSIEDKVKAFDVGGADYIVKPFQTKEIFVRVKNQLDLTEMRNKLLNIASEQELLIQKRTQELKNTLNEKIVLLKEVHHRVKNNMQIISSLLYLKKEMTENPEVAEAINESRNRILAMALIHEQIYKSEGLSTIELKTYIEELTHRVLSSYEMDDCGLEISSNSFNFEITAMIPIGLIVNELITNSLKHARRPDSKLQISIAIEKENDFYKLEYKDNGQGIPESISFDNTKTLGLNLIYNLSKQLGGDAEIIRGNGANISIKFIKRQSNE